MAKRKTTTGLVVHCAATRPGFDVGVKEIRAWHMDQGWSDCGYHVVIRRDGRVEAGRPLGEIGAHVKGHNATTVGICLVGGLAEDGETAEDNFTPEQRTALRAVLQVLRMVYGDVTIKGHRDYSPDKDGDGVVEPEEWMKACPSFDVATWLATCPELAA